MKRRVEFPLENGTSILVEVDEPESDAGMRRAGVADVTERAKQTFEDALDKIKPLALAIITKLKQLSDLPDEIEVEFGVKLNAESGAILASAGVEANYKVTLIWKKNRQTS